MIVTLLLALSTSLADSSSLDTEANLSLSSLDRSSQTPSSPGPPTPPATAQTNPVPRARTLWTPHDEAVEQAAEGSLAVCRTALLPFVVVPVLGSAAGLLAEWGCILPAALALEHVSLHHSSRGAELWQSMVALTAGKTAATLVELPMPFLVVGSIVVVGLGTGVAAFYGGLPITTAVAGTVVAGAVVFAAADVAADGAEDLVFSTVYRAFERPHDPLALPGKQKKSKVPEKLENFAAAFALASTTAGAKPEFSWLHIVPVAGPLIHAEQQANASKAAMRRTAKEALWVEKKNLDAMDDAEDLLSGMEGWLKAGAHVGILATAGAFASSLVFFYRSIDLDEDRVPRRNDVVTAEVIGGIGIGAGIGAAGLYALGETAHGLRPFIVPTAWALSAGDPTELNVE